MTEQTDFSDELPGAEPPHHEIHLSDYWAVIYKYRRLIIVGVLVALAGGVLMTVISRPMYRATTVLDIVRQNNNQLGLPSAGSYEGDAAGEFLPSQIELLKSRDASERVVKRLNLLANPDFNPESAKEFTPDAKGKARQPTSEDLSDAAMAVKGNIDAVPVRGTSLVQVSYTATTPKLAADGANAVADAYIDWNIESRFRLIGQSAQFLATQIVQAKREIEEKERALAVYARQKDIVSVDPRSNAKLESINRDYAVAVADRVSKEARYQELQGTPAEAIAESAGAAGLLAQLRSDQDKLERDYTEKLNTYKPEFPAMQQLKKQIEDGRQHLRIAVEDTATKSREAARSDYLMALRRETGLQALMKTQQVDAFSQGANSSEFGNLQVEIDSKRALLDTLLKQQGETEILSRLREQQIANVRVVDRALVPGGPFKPSLPRNLLISFVLGSGIGLGLAFLLSYLDRSLRTTDEVERHLGLPALGAVPRLGNAGWSPVWPRGKVPRESGAPRATSVELMPHREPRSAIAEAYRAFRTALLFSKAGGVKTVAITSVLPQEGKSSTAVNLAVVLAQLGRRVLLVDADLHRSRVHQILGVPNTTGLVSILAEGMEPSRVIARTSVPGVFVVPAGPETPNPSALLSSDDMVRFLALAETNFDHVIVDTPPLLATSDVLVFAQHTDGVVICVRAGSTLRDQVRRVRDKLIRGGVPILGVLLSGLKLETDYYRHDYRYLNYGERAAPAEAPAPPSQAGTAS